MSDSNVPELRPTFNGSLHVECREAKITSDGGAVVLREISDRLGVIDWLAERLIDPRNPDHIVHPLVELIRTKVFLLALGRRDHDDADALRNDPALRLSVSERRALGPLLPAPVDEFGQKMVPDGLASQPTLSRLYQAQSDPESRRILRDSLCEFAVRRIVAENGGHKHQTLGIDVDSIPLEVHGAQEGAKYNGLYEAKIYHPIVASVAETGDILDIQLREGNVHTAHDSLDFILAILEKMKGASLHPYLRIDAGFPEEQLLNGVEVSGAKYVARIKSNAVLDRMGEPHVRLPVGRPPKAPRTWFYEKMYKAEEWTRARRVVLVVQEVHGELFPKHFWLLTNWSAKRRPGEMLLPMYRERGTAEGHQGEFKSVFEPALSSASRPRLYYRGKPIRRHAQPVKPFEQNEVQVLFNAIAYNVAHAGRVLMARATGEGWSLSRFRERVLLAGGVLTTHANGIKMVISGIAQQAWQQLWPTLAKFTLATT